MAEPLRGAAHRLHPARVSESRPRPWRTTPAPHPGSLLRVLPPGAYSPLARQGCAPLPFNRAAVGRILVEREVSTRPVVVREVASQGAAQVPFAKNEDVIQTLAPDGADEPLREGVCHGL